MSILLVGVTYAAVYVAKMPISLPFLEAQAIYTPPEQGIRIAKQWEDVKIYKLKERVETVEEIRDTKIFILQHYQNSKLQT